ncbi:MAG: tetratricopeptide repeat protein [Candidatus Cryptobacteroides sp.]|uniref:tetratricopeptide repeat protein n=1 Tax=Candidatus Cryptobacteroides sp. TaxID=2952915 RepID=UPI002A911BA6|nr:tetratricopeptide repeat protein [Candidatus Cryptobacteroides sp.]MDY5566399.1 tetratricopeptide repeat protein [Candidatus Cryptobacteroides sp.]
MAYLFLNLAAAFLTAVGATMLPASEDVGSTVDSLLLAFDSQKGEESRRTASLFFELLEQEEFSDGKIEIPDESRPLKALTWYWAGEWYFDCQDYDRSMEYSLKAINLSKFHPDPLLEADCANVLSILHFRRSDYPKAMEYAERTLEIAREQKDISRISTSLNTLAGICLASRQPAQGEQYILEAIHLCEQGKDSLKLAIRCGMAAEIYHSMGDNRKSLEYSQRAYALDSLSGRTDKAAIRLAQMADACYALGDHTKAKACLEKAMPVLKEAGNLQSWAISANLYGEILLESGETSEAETYFREALKIFSLRRDRYNESRSRHGLSKSLLESDPAESARQMQIYSSLRDSLYDSEMNMGLNEMHARFQNGRLQSERDSYRRSLILLSALLVLIALATASYIFIRRRRLIKAETSAGSPASDSDDTGRQEQSPQTEQSEESRQCEQSEESPQAEQSEQSPQAEQSEQSTQDEPGEDSRQCEPGEKSIQREQGEESRQCEQSEESRQCEQSEESEFIENLGALIREAMDSGKVDFEEIASRMCISRTHLNRKVKSITGGTTSDLVLSYRIAKAKELLLTTDLPVWEVAEQCGISDPAYFSTLFKKAVGKSPGQLRKERS